VIQGPGAVHFLLGGTADGGVLLAERLGVTVSDATTLATLIRDRFGSTNPLTIAVDRGLFSAEEEAELRAAAIRLIPGPADWGRCLRGSRGVRSLISDQDESIVIDRESLAGAAAVVARVRSFGILRTVADVDYFKTIAFLTNFHSRVARRAEGAETDEAADSITIVSVTVSEI